ncbi:NAD(P)/FAD-dependent oxidoreductase [Streptacidiphilus griseoplanus]|uniref:NAD(P)/FAD-dependent oxidoreductase n=1 Tax=Peterkaempfera griseoplana TaxID=66896 RepID=UPI001FE17ED6|nr:FAD-dependent oxidoreductase [Peterkaempfera griseoplana]
MEPVAELSSDGRIVIVGAGVAGAQTAAALREHGWTGGLTLLGDEPHPPYDRPPLSKDVLLGKADSTAFDLDWAALGVELLTGRRALRLEGAEQTVITDAGPVRYDRLVAATGASAVPLPGALGVPGVHLLRTVDDALALRAALRPGARVVIVGAGWIGAETATAARALGCTATVVEAGPEPLPGALPAELGRLTRDWYAAAGVELRTGAAVAEVEPTAVHLADGTRLDADTVVVGVGARPATGWLGDSGVTLEDHGAVLADDRLRTTLPGVHAVGDCASFPSGRFGARLTVQHWDNALHGARTVAADLLGGDAAPYDPVPYFWSEQFGRMVQYAGHHLAADRLLWRGAPEDAGWTVLWLRGEVPVALLAVDRPRDLAQGRRLIERAVPLDAAAAADPAVPLKSAAR